MPCLKGTFGSVRDRAGEMALFIARDSLNMCGLIGRRFSGGDVLGKRGCAAKYDESAGSPYRESSHGLLLKRTMLPQASTTPECAGVWLTWRVRLGAHGASSLACRNLSR